MRPDSVGTVEFKEGNTMENGDAFKIKYEMLINAAISGLKKKSYGSGYELRSDEICIIVKHMEPDRFNAKIDEITRQPDEE